MLRKEWAKINIRKNTYLIEIQLGLIKPFHVVLYVILGWYYLILGRKFIMIFNWEEKTWFWPIRKFVYLIFITNFRNIIPKITSQNIAPTTSKGFLCTKVNTTTISPTSQDVIQILDFWILFWNIVSQFAINYSTARGVRKFVIEEWLAVSSS